MSYWSYYVAWTLLAYALRQPWLLVGVGVFLLLRKVIPDPTSLFRALARSRALRSQVEVNPANVTARRDLAQIYLDLLRPRAALTLVQQALVRTPNEPEMLYLAGLAQHRAGKHEEALPNLVRAVELDPRVRFGLPYLVAGDALFALGRYEEAADAYERYSESNSSDVSGYVRLAKTYARLGKKDDARRAIDEAESTWRVLPSRMRQRTFFKGYAGPRWARVTVLKQPGAVLGTIFLAVAAAAAGVWLYPTIARLWQSAPSTKYPGMEESRRALLEAFTKCGSQSTGAFAGHYLPVDLPRPPPDPNESDERRVRREGIERENEALLDNFEIGPDRIRSGSTTVQEFCLSKTLENTADQLRAEAVWREDVNDPDNARLVEIRLKRDGDRVKLSVLFDRLHGGGEWRLTVKRKD